MVRLAIPCLLWLLAAPAAAGCLAPGREGGEIRAELTRVELDRAERRLVEERFAPDFAEAARLGLAADALFRFARCELNGAAPAELVAVGRSPAHCSRPPGGRPELCGVWALARTAHGWVQVLETSGAARLSDSTTQGWRDLVVERGGPPAVLKFGGAVYQEDLGDAAPAPAALEDYGGLGAGTGDIAWFAYDDPTPERLEAAFLRFYADEIRGAGARVGALPDAFRLGLAELDGRPPEEAVVRGATPAFCTPEGCVHWILSDLEAERPRVLGRLRGFELRAAATGGRGGRDLIARGPEGLRVWRNDGDGWRLPQGGGD